MTVFIIFGGLGLMMLWVGVTQFIQQRRLLAAAQGVEAEIVVARVTSSSSVDTSDKSLQDHSTSSYTPRIEFTYSVDGATYKSDLLYPTSIVRGFASRQSAAQEIESYKVGDRVQAFVAPDAPDKAFLRAQAGAGPVVFIILGLVLPPIAWLAGKLI